MSQKNQTSESLDFISAASLGHYNVVQQLLETEIIDVNQVNQSGWTALMCAANYGHFNVIKLLIGYNAYVNYQDSQGRTALMMAACSGHTRCMEALITCGNADKYLKDLSGVDAMGYAKNNGHGNNKLIKLLFSDSSEAFQIRGRYYSHPKSEPIVKPDLIATAERSIDNNREQELFNPYKFTPFSTTRMPSIRSNLNPRAEDFIPLSSANSESKPLNSSTGSNASDGSNGSSVSFIDSFLTDYLLNERSFLKDKVQKLEKRLRELSQNQS